MNYYTAFFDEFQSYIQTSNDEVLLKIFKGNRKAVEKHFNLSVKKSMEIWADEITVGNVAEEIGYIFKKGFHTGDILKSNNLVVWEIINYEQTNFWRALRKTVYNMLMELECLPK